LGFVSMLSALRTIPAEFHPHTPILHFCAFLPPALHATKRSISRRNRKCAKLDIL
jgi:hypothetical protein